VAKIGDWAAPLHAMKSASATKTNVFDVNNTNRSLSINSLLSKFEFAHPAPLKLTPGAKTHRFLARETPLVALILIGSP
jgi:hypothetical protein